MIIGHRGARGLARENTLTSIQRAMHEGIQAVEIDVHLTKDHQFVLHHDTSLMRIYGVDQKIRNSTLEELRKIAPDLLPLSDILNPDFLVSIFIEIKDKDAGTLLAKTLGQYPGNQAAGIISFHKQVLRGYQEAGGQLPVYFAVSKKNWMFVWSILHSIPAQGLVLNTWNAALPIHILLSRLKRLRVIVYPVNNRSLQQWLRVLNPNAWVCTDRPDKIKA